MKAQAVGRMIVLIAAWLVGRIRTNAAADDWIEWVLDAA